MHIEESVKLDFKDVLIRPKRSTLTSRLEVDIRREFLFHHSRQTYRGIPIIASNMDSTGTIEMAHALAPHQLSAALHKHHSTDDLVAFFQSLQHSAHAASTAFYSMGISPSDYDKFTAVMARLDNAIEYVCIDVANGYTEGFINFVKKVRKEFPHLTIMAGNVVTGDITEELILAGADIVKVGIGPGSVCTTRKMTGVGYPQLSAVIECADAAHGLGGQICADGGCAVPGDLAKAFGGGADFIMLGGMLAGHDECAGEVVEREGKKYKCFYGMSSRAAMEKYAGGVADYRAAEGKEVLVEYRGPVVNTLQEILGGVRSACTYVGAHKLKELTKRTTFIRVTQQLNEVFGKS
ncbi:GMP reductase (Guanosine 5'-monophosphate oxidoreductase) (Guanosine monophosphate reductase) [Herminiimonas arsenicoxydans]|uniref:GMP reductase n=1 Tax=Herminiimonas arsenicoxydans TaxID=204773 RepID=A4G886_HERAR|nr:GMP reductase (Guanosine 5'-monophosphate oxidoreductase) (Guanosine monophosphate reductase) [Herminiimonas arsenicoxydans]